MRPDFSSLCLFSRQVIGWSMQSAGLPVAPSHANNKIEVCCITLVGIRRSGYDLRRVPFVLILLATGAMEDLLEGSWLPCSKKIAGLSLSSGRECFHSLTVLVEIYSLARVRLQAMHRTVSSWQVKTRDSSSF